MGLLFAILLLGVPMAAAIYDLLKTGDGVGNFKIRELLGMKGPSAAPARSTMPASAPASTKSNRKS